MPMYDDPAEKPLFGEPRPQDRLLNLVIGIVTLIVVLETLISAFAVPWPPKAINICFAVVILLICGALLVLIFWYRKGDLEPKFRRMILYNAFTIVLLCVVGNLYIHNIG